MSYDVITRHWRDAVTGLEMLKYVCMIKLKVQFREGFMCSKKKSESI